MGISDCPGFLHPEAKCRNGRQKLYSIYPGVIAQFAEIWKMTWREGSIIEIFSHGIIMMIMIQLRFGELGLQAALVFLAFDDPKGSKSCKNDAYRHTAL